jgi:hypothetical protein
MSDANAVRELLRRYSQGKFVSLKGHGTFTEGVPLGEPWGCEVEGFGQDTRRYDRSIHSGGSPRFQGWVNWLNKQTHKVQILPLGVEKFTTIINDIDAKRAQRWYHFERIETGEKRTDVRYLLKAQLKKGESWTEVPIPNEEYNQMLRMPLWDLEHESFAKEDGEKEPSHPNPHWDRWLREHGGAPAPPPPPRPVSANNGQPISAAEAHALWKHFESLPEAQEAWGKLHSRLEITDISHLPKARLAEAKKAIQSILQELSDRGKGATPPPPPPGPMTQDELAGKSGVWDDGDGA